jgi:hypothetical protein
MAEKGVSLTVTFKEAAIGVEEDAKFLNLVDETISQFKAELGKARVAWKQAKDGEVDGIPTLQDKGVGVSLTFDF